MRGLLKNHILVFGIIDHLPALLSALRHYTNQSICFVSNIPPNEKWNKLKKKDSNIFYFESSLNDVEELSRTAIEDAYHVILLTWLIEDSSVLDSGILPIIRIIEENFSNIPFTL